MTQPPPRTSPRADASYAPVGWLLLLYVLFVVYGSFVPWRYVDRPLADAIEAFKSIPFLQLGIGSRADWVANLLLFIPMTFLAGVLLTASGQIGRRIWVSCLIAILAMLFAVSIEFTQLFFPQRTVSQNDIFAESLGGLIGLGLFWLFGDRFHAWLSSFSRIQQQKDRIDRLLYGYLILLFIFNVLPLDLTLSPVELFHKWKGGRVVLLPFAGLKGGIFNGFYEVVTDILIWLPAGLLWTLRGQSTVGRVVRQGLLAALVIELLQFFVYSRVTDVTDICLAGVGAWLGWVVVQRLSGIVSAVSRNLERWWLALWLAWAVFTLGIFWFPFNFSLDGLIISAANSAFTRLPFTTYYFTSEYHAINELLRKLGFFLPGGLLLGFAVYKTNGSKRRAAFVPMLLLVLLAITVEAGQLALPGKVADVTDALLESAGGILGYMMALWVGSGGNSQIRQSAAKLPIDHAEDSHAKLPQRAQRPLWAGTSVHVAYVVALSILIGLVFRLPGVPYNLRELLAPGFSGVISALGLATVAYSIANGSFVLFASRQRRWLFVFPVGILAHGLLVWLLLRVAVPIESLHDIVGSPVLGWPWEWEMLGRYIALHMSVMLQMLGAALFVRFILSPARVNDFFYWALVNVLVAWPLHLVVVTWAATDNLTELMAGGGSFLTSSALASAWFLTCLTASAISAAFCSPKRVGVLFALAISAALGAAALFWFGTEHVIVKYDRVFSAFQFLLSTDRQHYVQGHVVWLRYGVAFAVVCGVLAATQWFCWRAFCNSFVQGTHSLKRSGI